jgi:hypothetical protein
MKKLLGIVLSLLMILSLASFSFADSIDWETNEVLGLEGPFDYEEEERAMRDPKNLAYGRTAYYIIYNVSEDTIEPIFDRDYTEKLKLKVEYEMGKELVDHVAIAKKRIDVANSDSVVLANLNAKDGYYYTVAVEIKDKQTTSDADIIGTFTFNRKEIDINDDNVVDPFEVEIDDVEFDFNINVFYGGYDYLANSGDFVVTGDIELEDDESYALKFDSDDEVEFAFGEDATFLVDVSGQNKLYMKWDTKPVEDIVDANPDAVIDFINFHNVKFNRSGEFCYEMEDVVAAYKVVDGKLVEIRNAVFDVDEVIFNTRTLENYVFSTKKLVHDVEVEVVRPSAPIVTNPNTGVDL